MVAMVILGKISDPYGVRGWVKVRAFADDPLVWAKMPAWWLADEGSEDWRQKVLRAARQHGDGLVCHFDGVGSRDEAELLKGCLVGAPRSFLPDLDDGEYYWADLIGLEVLNHSGVSLGRVVGLIETGASAVLKVEAVGGRERLLPFVAPIVGEVDRSAGVIRVDWESDW